MLESLAKLFEKFSEKIGLKPSTSNEILFWILVFIITAGVVKQIWILVKKIILWKNQRVLNKDLSPYYSKADVERATKYYISTKYQNVAPSIDDEPGGHYIASAKNKLIPLFLDSVFKFKTNSNKHFLIFADTGMGKTTLLINLYIAYKNKLRLPFNKHKYSIKLFPVWFPNCLEEINKIEDKGNTILLLDAFDEDIEAAKNYNKRMNDILTVTNTFRAIVITCRTQFFPTEKEEPYLTGFFTGGEHGEYKFQKLYLSVFDEKDVTKYLRKQFSLILQFGKYKKARQIVRKSPNLVVRPMLLSHIKELIESNKQYKFTFQIYEELINKWIEREASKYGVKELYGNTEVFQKNLYAFSENLAMNLYENRKERNGYFIHHTESFQQGLLKLSDISQNSSSLADSESRRKSLLNRTAAGEYKFSHKSILEYFLAKNLIKNVTLYSNFDFSGVNVVRLFLKEMMIWELQNVKTGEYYSSNNISGIEKRKKENAEDLTVKKMDKIQEIKINTLPINLLLFKEFKNLSFLFYVEYLPVLRELRSQIEYEISAYISEHKGSKDVLPEDALYHDSKDVPIFHLLYKAILEKSGIIDGTSTTLAFLRNKKFNHLHDFLIFGEHLVIMPDISVSDIPKMEFTDTLILSLQKIESFLIDKEKFESRFSSCKVSIL